MKDKPVMENAIADLIYPDEWVGCRWCGNPFKPPPSRRGKTKMCSRCRRAKATENCKIQLNSGERSEWDFCKSCKTSYRIRLSHPYDHECNDCLKEKYGLTKAERARRKFIELMEEVARQRKESPENEQLYKQWEDAASAHLQDSLAKCPII